MQDQGLLIEFNHKEIEKIKVHCLPRTKNVSYTLYQLNAKCFVSSERSELYFFGFR